MNVIDGGEGAPPEPTWSRIYRAKGDQEAASICWRAVVSEMSAANTLSLTNAAAIKRLVMFHVQFERAAADVAKLGAVRKAVKTKVPFIHPAWTIMKQAAEAAAALEAELGVSPRRRNSAGKVERRTKVTRAADRFLKPVAG